MEVDISDDLINRSSRPDAFRRFDDAVVGLLAVPHSVILKREAVYKAKAALNPNRRGPKPKMGAGAP